MRTDLAKVAFDAEVDRLTGVYLKVKMLAKSQRMEFEAAGRQAVANGLIAVEDWDMVKLAVSPGH